MKKGFTLIELLAVIVVLAIIALIAVPVVLNIINDAKESSLLRSAEFYLDAVEYTIADAFLYHGGLSNGEYPITPEGNICKKALPCDDANTLKVEVNGDKPTGGIITIDGGNISDVELVLNERTISKNSKGELVYLKYLDEVCKLVSGTAKTAGAKYTCEVKEGTSYTFYVLNSTSTEINLIMNSNINSSGEAVIPGETSDTGLVAWSPNGLNSGGPVAAMQFLYNATKDWTNIDPITYEYKDKEYQGTTEENTSYTSFVSKDGVLTITALDETITTIIGTSDVPLRVRMPIYTSDVTKTEVANKTASSTYLYDNLDTGGSLPYGYWTLSSYAGNSVFARAVHYSGSVYYDISGVDTDYGVRPVITLKL